MGIYYGNIELPESEEELAAFFQCEKRDDFQVSETHFQFDKIQNEVLNEKSFEPYDNAWFDGKYGDVMPEKFKQMIISEENKRLKKVLEMTQKQYRVYIKMQKRKRLGLKDVKGRGRKKKVKLCLRKEHKFVRLSFK